MQTQSNICSSPRMSESWLHVSDHPAQLSHSEASNSKIQLKMEHEKTETNDLLIEWFLDWLAMHLTKYLKNTLHLMSRGVKQNIQLWNCTFWIENMVISWSCDSNKDQSYTEHCTCNKPRFKVKTKICFFIKTQHNTWKTNELLKSLREEKKTKVDWMHEFVFMMCYNAFSITIIIYKSLLQLKGCVNCAHSFFFSHSVICDYKCTRYTGCGLFFLLAVLTSSEAAVLWSRELINWNCNKDRIIYATPQVKPTNNIREQYIWISPFHWLP